MKQLQDILHTLQELPYKKFASLEEFTTRYAEILEDLKQALSGVMAEYTDAGTLSGNLQKVLDSLGSQSEYYNGVSLADALLSNVINWNEVIKKLIELYPPNQLTPAISTNITDTVQVIIQEWIIGLLQDPVIRIYADPNNTAELVADPRLDVPLQQKYNNIVNVIASFTKEQAAQTKTYLSFNTIFNKYFAASSPILRNAI